MDPQWIFMLIVWGAVEAFGAFKKVPQPKRMRRGAIAAFLIGFLTSVGYMPADTEPLTMYGVSAALNGIPVLLVYGVRVLIQKLLKKTRTE